MKRRHKRIIFIVCCLAALGLSTWLVLGAFKNNLVFFFSPTQVAAHFAASGNFRPGAPTNVVPTVGINQAGISWGASTTSPRGFGRSVIPSGVRSRRLTLKSIAPTPAASVTGRSCRAASATSRPSVSSSWAR